MAVHFFSYQYSFKFNLFGFPIDNQFLRLTSKMKLQNTDITKHKRNLVTNILGFEEKDKAIDEE